jgi:hypothetical protein
MKIIAQKLAVAVVTAAAFAPVGAMAAPALTSLEQVQQSVDATFNNTFAQSVGVSGASAAGLAAGDVLDTGAGVTNVADYTLTPNFSDVTGSLSVIGGTSAVTLTAVTDVTASMAANAGTGVLTLDPDALAGESVSVSTTVFGVENIRATQSVVESTTTTLF